MANLTMPPKKPDIIYSEEETVARAEAALKRMLATPHKPHSEMKLGKRKVKADAKASPGVHSGAGKSKRWSK